MSKTNLKRTLYILKKNFQNLIMKRWKNYKWKYKHLRNK